MKNKVLLAVCAFMAFGLIFAGCENGTQVVEFAAIGKPANVQVQVSQPPAITILTTGPDGLLKVTWDAAANATGYTVVATQDLKKKTWVTFGTGRVVTTTTGNNPGDIPDVDKWEYEWTTHNLVPSITAPSGYTWVLRDASRKGTWFIGVIANPRRSDQRSSSPAWYANTINLQ